MKIQIEEVSNGYMVNLDWKAEGKGLTYVGKTSVYKSTEVLQMIEEVGRIVYGRKVKVVEK